METLSRRHRQRAMSRHEKVCHVSSQFRFLSRHHSPHVTNIMSPPSVVTATLPIPAARLDVLTTAFAAAFGPSAHALLLARAPGRVNLIGEHIDYAGFAVLPMAIDKDLVILAGTRPGTGKVLARSFGYEAAPLEFAHPISAADIDATRLEWANYFQAGYIGAYDKVLSLIGDGNHENSVVGKPVDQCYLIHSTVPAGSGLSSSSAMTVAVVLATLGLALSNDPKRLAAIPKEMLTQVAIETERLVGVNAGGMDQSISMLAQPSSAGLVHFTPELKLEPVPLPAGAVFVIAHSLVTADKHATAPTNYNLRVVETRLAARVLAQHTNPSANIFADLIDFSQPTSNVASQLSHLESLAREHLTNDATFASLATLLDTSASALEREYTSDFPVRFTTLRLLDRTLHVVSEARRVLDTVSLLHSPSGGASARAMGRLMHASHVSCRDLYTCSCAELDELVALGEANGSLGSRLTGAGWGGCSVHLLEGQSEVEGFIESMYKGYYEPRGVGRQEARDKWVFASGPKEGAGVYLL
ncbi:ribosomal protein S5 domain 2-type protein [Catenaria anguillulae PL171]|uniref:Galactokinase n=1 Tax=Catenaria anguillulae PL171 TaxID=765915 RepID=A0A1Y2HVX1_9FUNG|nr:ribosomal protein S5 domain 2-type protein [Catenaria anguillulae PL171]